MPWLKTIPLLSMVLVLTSYVIFGWQTAHLSVPWSTALHEGLRYWQWEVDEKSILLFIHIFALLIITLTTLGLTAPMVLMTYTVGSWARSELRSMVSMLFWSFMFVVSLRWFNYFTFFLLLWSAAILGRIELRYLGLNQGTTLLALLLICSGSFTVGVLAYFHYYPLPF